MKKAESLNSHNKYANIKMCQYANDAKYENFASHYWHIVLLAHCHIDSAAITSTSTSAFFGNVFTAIAERAG